MHSAGDAGNAGEGGAGGGADLPDEPWEEVPADAIEVVYNPYRTADLTALIKIAKSELDVGDLSWVELQIQDPDSLEVASSTILRPEDADYPSSFDFSDLLTANEFGVPVLGLFQNTENHIRLRFTDGHAKFTAQINLATPNVYASEVVVHTRVPEEMEPGLTYLSAYAKQYGYLFDEFGRVRWRGPRILALTEDGQILSGMTLSDWFGRETHRWHLPSELNQHHDAFLLPNGHLLACINDRTSRIHPEGEEERPSLGDRLVELDRESNIEDIWDLREFLDVNRHTVTAKDADWAHVNTVSSDPEDGSLLVSVRYHGILKLTGKSEPGADPASGKSLAWILGPHLDWGLAGADGTGPIDPKEYLLTAIDSENAPFPQTEQLNLAAAGGFHWPVGQHGIVVSHHEPGKLRFLTFNNQASFIFDGPGTIDNGSSFDATGDFSNDRANPPYSLISEYEVDEASMTVRELWSFGSGYPELYGSFNGGINHLPQTGNRVMISNGSSQHTEELGLNPHFVELSADGQVVFHLEVPNSGAAFSAYRGGRVDPYHPTGK